MVKTREAAHKSKPAGISEKVVRLLESYTLIARKEFPSVKRLMEHFHVTERTVYRYLEIINFIDPVEYDREMDGYKFTHGDRIKKPAVSEQELLVLLAAGEAVTHLGPAFHEHFEKVVAKMVSSGRTGRTGEGKIPVLIRMADAGGTGKLDETVRAAFQCAAEKRSLHITYRAQHNKTVTQRLVDPYGLIFHEGTWILVGYCHLRKSIRSFALDRVLDMKERYLYFTVKEGFDLEKYLSHSWGIYDDEEVSVTVQFTSAVSDYILRKERWHPSEKREVLADGEVRLSFTVAGVDEIKRWIYSWIPHVRVLEPVSLREKIREELSLSVRDHSS
jgi:predicted DNA-binding transcriptional regulator YafY